MAFAILLHLKGGEVMTSIKQEVQQCIDQCNQQAQQLRSMSQSETNAKMKEKLFEASHHIDLCVTECSFITQRP